MNCLMIGSAGNCWLQYVVEHFEMRVRRGQNLVNCAWNKRRVHKMLSLDYQNITHYGTTRKGIFGQIRKEIPILLLIIRIGLVRWEKSFTTPKEERNIKSILKQYQIVLRLIWYCSTKRVPFVIFLSFFLLLSHIVNVRLYF